MEKTEEEHVKDDLDVECPVTMIGVGLGAVQDVNVQEDRDRLKSALSSVTQEIADATLSRLCIIS